MKYELPRYVCLGMQLLPYISMVSLLWALCVVVFLFNIFSKYAPVHASLNIGQVNAYMCQVSVFIDDKIVIIIVSVIVNSIICHCPLYKFSNYLPLVCLYSGAGETTTCFIWSLPYSQLLLLIWQICQIKQKQTNKSSVIN